MRFTLMFKIEIFNILIC